MIEQTTIPIPEQPASTLEAERLTAGFDCPLTPEEKRRKMKRAKVHQGGLFVEERGPELPWLWGSAEGSDVL